MAFEINGGEFAFEMMTGNGLIGVGNDWREMNLLALEMIGGKWNHWRWK